jgi:hypothetical protein
MHEIYLRVWVPIGPIFYLYLAALCDPSCAPLGTTREAIVQTFDQPAFFALTNVGGRGRRNDPAGFFVLPRPTLSTCFDKTSTVTTTLNGTRRKDRLGRRAAGTTHPRGTGQCNMFAG